MLSRMEAMSLALVSGLTDKQQKLLFRQHKEFLRMNSKEYNKNLQSLRAGFKGGPYTFAYRMGYFVTGVSVALLPVAIMSGLGELYSLNIVFGGMITLIGKMGYYNALQRTPLGDGVRKNYVARSRLLEPFFESVRRAISAKSCAISTEGT